MKREQIDLFGNKKTSRECYNIAREGSERREMTPVNKAKQKLQNGV